MADGAQRLRVTYKTLYDSAYKYCKLDEARHINDVQDGEMRKLKAEPRVITDERDLLKEVMVYLCPLGTSQGVKAKKSTRS
jgi:hypothetical protein